MNPTSIPGVSSRQLEVLALTQVSKHLCDSHSLQKLGFQVDVQVFRLSAQKGVTLEDPGIKPAELRELVLTEAVPYYQLRAVQEQKAQEAAGKAPIEAQHDVFESQMRNNYIYPKAGYVRVELTNPATGKTYKGECHVGFDKIFNRKVASKRAFGKMFGKMLADSSMGKRLGKQVLKGLAA